MCLATNGRSLFPIYHKALSVGWVGVIGKKEGEGSRKQRKCRRVLRWCVKKPRLPKKPEQELLIASEQELLIASEHECPIVCDMSC
jgi:hypothetical protein